MRVRGRYERAIGRRQTQRARPPTPGASRPAVRVRSSTKSSAVSLKVTAGGENRCWERRSSVESAPVDFMLIESPGEDQLCISDLSLSKPTLFLCLWFPNCTLAHFSSNYYFFSTIYPSFIPNSSFPLYLPNFQSIKSSCTTQIAHRTSTIPFIIFQNKYYGRKQNS